MVEQAMTVQRPPLPRQKSRRKGLKTLALSIAPACLQTLEEGNSVWMGRLIEEDCGLRDWINAAGNQSAMAVPVRSEGRLDGVLLVESRDEVLTFSRQEQHLLQLIAHILAGAMARNRVEQELRTNREFYWMILESLAEAVLLTTLEGRVLYANQAWATITGRSHEESMRLKLANLIHYEDVQKEEAAHLQALEGTLSEAYSLRLVTDRMGSFRWFKVMKKVVDLPILAGEAGLLITLGDDTERHEWEETLITAKVRAESMSEAKTLYLSKASHELRTPLHGILSLLELLQRTPLNPKQQRWVESAELSAKTLLGIFEDVLEVSKLECGVVKLNIRPTGLQSMMESVVAMFEKSANEKGLKLTLAMAANLPRVVKMDELRTRQILINLISNAVRYTTQGEINVRVELAERSRDDQLWLEFAVIDTGPGIPLQDQERLFIPFVQLENHQRVLGEGSGLGLPIVRELCRLMDADLRVESDGSTGTTMRFFLPTSLALGSTHETELGLSPALILQGQRVLVVEDNEISRYVASQHLKALGALVTTATDGTEAMEILNRQPQDLVLTDCAMPRMNGYELARWIRSLSAKRGGNCLIIACTADSSSDNRHQCLEAGMNGVLTKPYARQQLQHVIEQVISPPPLTSANATAWELPPGLAEAAVLRLDLIGISMDEDPAFAQHFLRRTFSMFRQLVPEELVKIRQALKEGDAAKLRKCLHHLKSSAAAVGAEQLATCCSWFEDLAQSASEHPEAFPAEDSVMEPLEQLVERCHARMAELLSQMPEADSQ
jgi:PAS domain S-box-containing protein